ncbi:hypothetical protein [uncultured Adlercreutzia sp.]|uniref:hypothetical protein n=1 Tax=uncultured Adlercreutzia sp. TaxID=875803 RepID=UPI00266CFB86|nr:hypothetical protein [uncultured Adlercreutzia sp.]
MTENTNQTPGATAGYGPEGRELERESLAYGEPARTPGDVETAAAGDASEMLGEVLQSQELNPDEPAVTNEPAVMPQAAPSVAVAPVQPQQPTAATHQAAYQATYGAPQQTAAPQAPTAPACAPGTPGAPTASPHTAAAATAAAVQKTRKTIDPEQVFRICGMIVGAVIIVFGLCMLAYYTPDDVSSLFDTYQMNGSAGFASAGATSAQVLKAGFSMLLIGFGATDICAFGAKYMKAKKREQK